MRDRWSSSSQRRSHLHRIGNLCFIPYLFSWNWDLAFRGGIVTFGGTKNLKWTKAMNGIQLFAFVILPLALAAGGWLIVLLNEYHNRR